MYVKEISTVTPDGTRKLAVSGLSPGFNLVYGPNEAGKSTLRHLLVGSLFPRPKAKGRVAARLRDTPDGLVLLGSGEGRLSLVTRKGVTEKTEGDQYFSEELEVTRESLDRRVYESLFCIGLDELTEMNLLSDQEITSRLSELSEAGSMARSVNEAIEELNKIASGIYVGRRNGSGSLDKLKREYVETEHQALSAARSIASLDSVRARLKAREKSLETERSRSRASQAQLVVIDEATRIFQMKEQVPSRGGPDVSFPEVSLLSREQLLKLRGAVDESLVLSTAVVQASSSLETLQEQLRETEAKQAPDRLLSEVIASFEDGRLSVLVDDIENRKREVASVRSEFEAACERYGTSQVSVGQISDSVLLASTSDMVDALEREGRPLFSTAAEVRKAQDQQEENVRRLQLRIQNDQPDMSLRRLALLDEFFEARNRKDILMESLPQVSRIPLLAVLLWALSILLFVGLGLRLGFGGQPQEALVVGVGVGLFIAGLWLGRAILGTTKGSKPGDQKADQDGSGSLLNRLHFLASELGIENPNSVAQQVRLSEEREALRATVGAANDLRVELREAEEELCALQQRCARARDEVQVWEDNARAFFVELGSPLVFDSENIRVTISRVQELFRARQRLARETESLRAVQSEVRERETVLKDRLVSIPGEPLAIVDALSGRKLDSHVRSLIDRQSELFRDVIRYRDNATQRDAELQSLRAELQEALLGVAEYLGRSSDGVYIELLPHLKDVVLEEIDTVSEIDSNLRLIAHSEEVFLATEPGSRGRLLELDPEETRAMREQLEADLADAESNSEALIAGITSLKREIGEIEEISPNQLELKLSTLLSEMAHLVHQHRVTVSAVALLRRSRDRYERESRPAVLNEAGVLLSRFTAGAYDSIRVTEGSPPKREKGFVIEGAGAGEFPKEISHLSKGTLEQLLLALRLAYLKLIVPNSQQFPILLDDICVNFDRERTMNVFEGLAEIARTRQIIMLTCHERERELFSRYVQHTEGGPRLVELH